MKIPLHIGFDDTDSVKGGCTTYIAALLVEKFRAYPFLDYPNLIRLNPNVPWKTRGNAALSLRMTLDEDLIDKTMEEVIVTVEEFSQLEFPKTDPGIVFLHGNVSPEITSFARRTIQDIVSKKEALDLIRHFGLEAVGFKGGRGIIGALAAVGEVLSGDYTFELIAYRTSESRGTPRLISSESIFKMDKKMADLTFNNVDYEKRRVLVTPHGPDPVLLGIRGEDPIVVKKAYQMIDVYEDVERWVIFRTNQGTDAHLRRVERIADLRPNRPIIVGGSVAVEPYYIPGRHLIFAIEDDSGCIDCAAYEPTGSFRKIVEKVIIGDHLEVYGGVRPASARNPKTINIEKMRIIKCTSKSKLENPICGFCGKHMKSMGRMQGFRCKRCGLQLRDVDKISRSITRDIVEGIYIPPPRSNRHLTKPISRYGLEKTGMTFSPTDFWGI